MAKYHLHLKGYVGAADFNSRAVDACLEQNSDTDVRVLIDSTGGQLATGLSIAAAFKNHGAVDVHFVSLNASAATVASLGARTVSMDRAAMYLVHKCSNVVFTWESMNADQLADYIDQLTKNKEDLDKIDDSIAAMYAARCRKPKAELLALMKRGGWLTAAEALEWGFIDKITDSVDSEDIVVTASLADDLKAAGIPLPGKVVSKSRGMSSIFTKIKDFMSAGSGSTNPEVTANNQQPPQTPAADQADSNQHETIANDANSQEDQTDTTPQAEAHEEPQTPRKVIDSATSPKSDADAFGAYLATAKSARDLFNSLP